MRAASLRSAQFCNFHVSTRGDPAKAEALDLRKCFEQFSVEEQLSPHDMWYCGKCAEHVQAYKRMALWRMPEILIVHLKRFQYSQGTFFVHRDKLDMLVDFPLEGFDLSEFVIGPQDAPPVYDLFAVSVRTGDRARSWSCWVLGLAVGAAGLSWSGGCRAISCGCCR